MRKNTLLLYVAFLLCCIIPMPMTAMLSKSQRTLEEQKYTQEELKKYSYLGEQLIDACDKGDLEKVAFWIKAGADINYCDHLGAYPLLYACQRKHENVIKYLLENGADVNAVNLLHKKNLTALHVACEVEDLEGVKLLLDNGADIEAENIDNETPLSTASAFNKDIKVVDYLIAKQAKIDTRNKYNATPLATAAIHNKSKIVAMLLRAGADANAVTQWDETALHYACFHKNHAMAESLLKAGVDHTIESKYGVTPLDVACDRNDNAMISLFNKYGIITKSQEQANKAMHEFFAELNQEKLQKIQKSVGQKKGKQGKNIAAKEEKIVSKKQIGKPQQQATSGVQSNVEETLVEQDIVPYPVTISTTTTTSTTDTTPTTSTTSTTSSVMTSPSEKTTFVIREEKDFDIPKKSSTSVGQAGEYQVVEGKQLKWPRSLKPKQEKLLEDQFKQLKNWPNHGLSDVVKLENKPGMYRLRVGAYRIIFSVNSKQRKIVIEAIGLRKNIYKKLS